ncbi:hypothetical protein [Phenylobacterium sp.]|uniref:hypothetical protein n=1 Tax=Phenylobacterium sp. TaxID=1871053 RepID=UPI0025D60F4D|nr:hypothetical protein [Phenylobacterium sp.]
MTLKRLPVAALAGLTAVTSGPGATAQPRRIVDGTPSADACAELGFRAPARPDYGRGVVMRRPAPTYAGPPPPAPPPPSIAPAPQIPPLPLPPVERRIAPTGKAAVQEMVVTAQRYQPYG